jgi:hypothetical protein
MRLKHAHAQVAPAGGADAPALLLLDLVELQAGQESAHNAGDEGGGPALALLPDLAAPERVFVRSGRAAWALTLAWLPAVANFLAEGVA